MSEPPNVPPSEPVDPNNPPPDPAGVGPQGYQPGYQPEYGQGYPPEYGQGYQPEYGQGYPPAGYGPGSGPAYGPGFGAPQPPRQYEVNVTRLLGARAWQRPEARFGSALAGAGAGLAVLGVYVWAIGYLVKGIGAHYALDDPSSSPHIDGLGRRFLGFGLFLACTAIGYAVLVTQRRGPLATAGTVATALGVPSLLAFLFLDINATLTNGDFPINLDAVFLISIVVWLISYFGVPGAHGRALYLALAALAFPAYIGFKVAGEDTFRAIASLFNGSDDASGGSSHVGTIAALGLVFGLVYYGIAWLLDRSGRHGVAIALLWPALATTASGLSAGSDDFGQVGTGVIMIVIGAAVACYAGRYGRRFTTWVGAGGAAAGVVLIVGKLDLGSKYWLFGILLIVIGAAAALAGYAVSRGLGEQPDVPEDVTTGA